MAERSQVTPGHQAGCWVSVLCCSEESSPPPPPPLHLSHWFSLTFLRRASLLTLANSPCLSPASSQPPSGVLPSHPLPCLGSINHQYPVLRRNTELSARLIHQERLPQPPPWASGTFSPSSGPCLSSSRDIVIHQFSASLVTVPSLAVFSWFACFLPFSSSYSLFLPSFLALGFL